MKNLVEKYDIRMDGESITNIVFDENDEYVETQEDFNPSDELILKKGMWRLMELADIHKSENWLGIEIGDGQIKSLGDLIKLINECWNDLAYTPDHMYLEILYVDKRSKTIYTAFGS